MSTNNVENLFELLNSYPSPHNGQPIRLKQTSTNHFSVYFERERGLSATEISYLFSFVSMGVFIAYAELCGNALGHKITPTMSLPPRQDLRGIGRVMFAEISVEWDAQPDDESLLKAIVFRQTSRKKYSEGLSSSVVNKITDLAKQSGMQLNQIGEEQVSQVIWLNQRAVFDDMFDKPVNDELNKWLRYSKKEKELKRDGLAYDCMELNGMSMKFIVNHPQVLRLPGISHFLEKYYLRTMSDSSDVFYMLAPFKTEEESFAVGTVISKIWLALSAGGYYLHPFGTIMSNQNAHQDFLKLAGVSDESLDKSYLVFIFRSGKSDAPVRSLRLPYQKHLIME